MRQRRVDRRGATLAVVCAALAVITIDTTILIVALPTMSLDLHATSSQLQWIVDSYALMYASLLLTAGSFGDRFGADRVLRIGLVLFAVASFAASRATSSGTVIGARAAMGICAALISPTLVSIISHTFAGHERSRALGVWAGVAAVGVGLGPLAGGVLLRHFWWGSVFLVNVPIVAVLLVCSRVVPAVPSNRGRKSDPLGVLLSFIGLFTLLWAVIEGPERGWSDDAVIFAFVIATMSLTLFLWWEQHAREPMLDLSLFRITSYWTGTTANITLAVVNGGVVFLLSQFLQDVQGHNALGAGVRLVPYALGMMFSASRAPDLVARVGSRTAITGGLACEAAGLLLLAASTKHTPYALTAIGLLVMAFGFGGAFSGAIGLSMSEIPADRSGVAAGANNMCRQAGQAASVAVVGSLLALGYRSRLDPRIGDFGLSPTQRHDARRSVASALDSARVIGGSEGEQLTRLAQDAFVQGMRSALFLCFALSVGGIILTYRFVGSREGVVLAEPIATH